MVTTLDTVTGLPALNKLIQTNFLSVMKNFLNNKTCNNQSCSKDAFSGDI